MAELRARTIFADRRFTVIAVESVVLLHGDKGHGRYLAANMKPVAVVVKEPNRTYAVDMEAMPISIDRDPLRPLINDLP